MRFCSQAQTRKTGVYSRLLSDALRHPRLGWATNRCSLDGEVSLRQAVFDLSTSKRRENFSADIEIPTCPRQVAPALPGHEGRHVGIVLNAITRRIDRPPHNSPKIVMKARARIEERAAFASVEASARLRN